MCDERPPGPLAVPRRERLDLADFGPSRPISAPRGRDLSGVRFELARVASPIDWGRLMPRRLQRTARGRDSVRTPTPKRSRPSTSKLAAPSPPRPVNLRVGLFRLVSLDVARARAELGCQRDDSEKSREERTDARRAASKYAYLLRASGHRAEVDAFREALGADGGRLVRLVADAHADFGAALQRGVFAFAELVARGVTDPAALSLLARSTIEGAIADAVAEAVVRGGMAVDVAGLSKLAREAGRESRLNLLSALHCAEEAGKRAPQLPTIDVEGAVRRFEAERAAERPAEPPEGEPDAGDGEAPAEGDDDADDGEPGHP